MKIAVVGAGIMGLSAAWALAKRGLEVAIYERAEEIPNPLSASGDHHRMMRHAYGSYDGYARLLPEADDAWSELWSDLRARHYVETGVLILSQIASDGGDILRAGLLRHNRRFSQLSAGDIWARYPHLAAGRLRYGVHLDQGGYFRCAEISASMVAWLRQRGVSVILGSEVTGLAPDAGLVQIGTGEARRFDRIILAAGAEAPILAPQLRGVAIPTLNSVSYLAPPAALVAAWRTSPCIAEFGGRAGGYAFPFLDGLGLKVGSGALGRPIASMNATRGQDAGYRSDLALVDPPFTELEHYRCLRRHACTYAVTADKRFRAAVIGRVIALSACSGHGYKFGPAVGRRVADAVHIGALSLLTEWIGG